MQKQNWQFGARHAFHKSFKAKSQRAIRLRLCESISLIFAPFYVNSSHQNRFKCCNLNGLNFSLIIIESLLLQNVGFIVRFYCFMFTEISFYTNWWSSLKTKQTNKKQTNYHALHLHFIHFHLQVNIWKIEIRTPDICDTGVVLYKLSYKAISVDF